MKPDTTILSSEQEALFCLLRAGLWEKTPADMSVFPLTDAGWRSVYRMAVRQTVAGIAYRGLHYLPDNMLPDEALMITWVAKADSIERINRKMNAVVKRLMRLMHGNGLHPVLLKGQGVAAFYTFPLLRECGDIDLYFRSKKEEGEASALMSRLGCQVERHADGSNCYSWQGVTIEHHTRLFDIYNPFLKGYLAALTARHGFSSQPLCGDCLETEDNTVTVPAPLPCLLLLDTHLLKHIMGHGVGLRQFCDMAVAYRALADRYSADELKAVYRHTGIYRWSRQLHTFLTAHLGLGIESLPYAGLDARTSPRLLRIVFDGGNFGRHADTSSERPQTIFGRKLHTFLSFCRHGGFSCIYAPKEAFWTSVNLIIGNIK